MPTLVLLQLHVRAAAAAAAALCGRAVSDRPRSFGVVLVLFRCCFGVVFVSFWCSERRCRYWTQRFQMLSMQLICMPPLLLSIVAVVLPKRLDVSMFSKLYLSKLKTVVEQVRACCCWA